MKNYKNKNPKYSQEAQSVVFEPEEKYGNEKERCLYCYDFLKDSEVHYHQACSKSLCAQV
jgi:hypothetical protein